MNKNTIIVSSAAFTKFLGELRIVDFETEDVKFNVNAHFLSIEKTAKKLDVEYKEPFSFSLTKIKITKLHKILSLLEDQPVVVEFSDMWVTLRAAVI